LNEHIDLEDVLSEVGMTNLNIDSAQATNFKDQRYKDSLKKEAPHILNSP